MLADTSRLLMQNFNVHMHLLMPEQNIIQHKMNTKNKARFSHLLRHPARKQNGPILKEVDK